MLSSMRRAWSTFICTLGAARLCAGALLALAILSSNVRPAMAQAPATPTGLSATAGDGQVALTWNTVTGATSYNVYRGTAAGQESATPIATGVAGPAYTDTGLTDGATYYYKVTAVNANGESGKSGEAVATPQGSLPTPQGVVASDDGSQVTVTWAPVTGAAIYDISRSTSASGPFTFIGSSTSTTYVDSSPAPGQPNYYEVTARNGGESSSPSAVNVSLQIHVIWTSDSTTNPVTQQASTAGSVGGQATIHVSFQMPPSGMPEYDVKELRIHEVSGDQADIVQNYLCLHCQDTGSPQCGDPDPNDQHGPGMGYCDFTWQTTTCQNSPYVISVDVEYSPDMAGPWQYITRSITVSPDNLLITSTTPANPQPVLWTPGTMTSVPLSATVTCCYTAQQAVTLPIYNSDQTLVKTYHLDQVIGAGATTLSATWDGSADICNPIKVSLALGAPNTGSGSYGYNAMGLGPLSVGCPEGLPTTPTVRMAQFQGPAHTVEVMEITKALFPGYILGPTQWGLPGDNGNCIKPQTGTNKGWANEYPQIPTWHGGRVNVLWVDGHVKFVEPPASQTTTAMARPMTATSAAIRTVLVRADIDGRPGRPEPVVAGYASTSSCVTMGFWVVIQTAGW
jgi:prepilin-type processing-associated H-X9-DG protein